MLPRRLRDIHPRRLSGRERGFTLIELLVTIVILAVLAALAAPSFTALIQKQRLRGAAENLFGDLQFAKSEAIKENICINLRVRTSGCNAGDSWCYDVVPGTSGTDCTVPGTPTVLKYMGSSGFAGVTGPTAVTIAFTPLQGLAAAQQMNFSNTAGTLSVTVNAMGRIKICSASVVGYEPCP